MSVGEINRVGPQTASRPALPSVAFLPVRRLHIPHNYREYYLSIELERRGWNVYWLRPASGTNDGVDLRWPVIRFPDFDIRGRKYVLPAWLALQLRMRGIRIVWLSGYTLRDLSELHWTVRILKSAGIRVVYDPIDPICEITAAQRNRASEDVDPRCAARARTIYHACDLTICVTPETRDMLIAHGAPADRLVVGRWGTDASRFDASRARTDLKEQLGLAPDRFLVGWLGTMERFKGLFELILPVIEATATQRPNVHFVLAGRGPLAEELHRWVKERPHLPVTLLPPIPYDDAPRFTGSLDAYLVATNPTTAYGRSICPVKCFDALAMGTPLIVTRTEGTAFLEAHSDLVELIDFDVGAATKAVLRLIDSDIQRKPRAERAVRHYSHQTVSSTIADAIAQLLV